MSTLNTRLSGLLEQVETIQRTVVKQDETMANFLTGADSASNDGQLVARKKREKKVKFDFTQQERMAQISELEEKVLINTLFKH